MVCSNKRKIRFYSSTKEAKTGNFFLLRPVIRLYLSLSFYKVNQVKCRPWPQQALRRQQRPLHLLNWQGACLWAECAGRLHATPRVWFTILSLINRMACSPSQSSQMAKTCWTSTALNRIIASVVSCILDPMSPCLNLAHRLAEIFLDFNLYLRMFNTTRRISSI